MDPARRATAEGGIGPHDEDLKRLRQLLMGPELDVIQGRLNDPAIRAEETSQVIAEAIALRSKRGSELRHALQSTIEEALRTSVQRDPHVLADLLFPVIGPAIRQAVTSSLNGMMDALNKTLEQSLSLRALQWRWEGWRTGKSFSEIVLLRSLLYRVEQVFLIHKETGLLLCHEAAQAAVVRDADLVSAMLTAIQDFVRDSFGPSRTEDLENMQVGEYQVLVQHGPSALLACMIRGVPPRELKSMIQDRLEQIHQHMAGGLARFKGDAAPFEAARPYLHSCLVGQLVHKRRRIPWMLSAAAVLALLASFILLFFHFRDQRRWSSYLDRLKSEPGIVVTSAEQFMGRYNISGLRDPLAADPQRLLEGTGIPPAKLTAHWEPYVSLDGKFTTLRRFDEEREKVERCAVFFPTASVIFVPDALSPVAAEIRLLLDAAAAARRPIRVEILGWTDAFGPEAVNAKLGQERADRVLAELVHLGVPNGQLAARAAGLGSVVPTQQDWYGRRVSFNVISLQ